VRVGSCVGSGCPLSRFPRAGLALRRAGLAVELREVLACQAKRGAGSFWRCHLGKGNGCRWGLVEGAHSERGGRSPGSMGDFEE